MFCPLDDDDDDDDEIRCISPNFSDTERDNIDDEDVFDKRDTPQPIGGMVRSETEEFTSALLGMLCMYMCVGPTKATYRRDIKMIVNHDYIKQCIIFAKNFLG